MSGELGFYEVKTENGTFWVRAARGSDARRAAEHVLAADPGSICLARDETVQFTEDPGQVTSGTDAARRGLTWALAGQKGHSFAEPGETFCRICGGGPEGIQHRKDYLL